MKDVIFLDNVSGGIDGVSVNCDRVTLVRMRRNVWTLKAWRGDKKITLFVRVAADGLSLEAVRYKDELGVPVEVIPEEDEEEGVG